MNKQPTKERLRDWFNDLLTWSPQTWYEEQDAIRALIEKFGDGGPRVTRERIEAWEHDLSILMMGDVDITPAEFWEDKFRSIGVDERLLRIYCMIQEIICEREAMIAMNQERERRGETLAYEENAFMVLVTRLQNIRMEI